MMKVLIFSILLIYTKNIYPHAFNISSSISNSEINFYETASIYTINGLISSTFIYSCLFLIFITQVKSRLLSVLFPFLYVVAHMIGLYLGLSNFNILLPLIFSAMTGIIFYYILNNCKNNLITTLFVIATGFLLGNKFSAHFFDSGLNFNYFYNFFFLFHLGLFIPLILFTGIIGLLYKFNKIKYSETVKWILIICSFIQLVLNFIP